MNSLEKHCGVFFPCYVIQSYAIKYYPSVGFFLSWLCGNTIESLANESK